MNPEGDIKVSFSFEFEELDLLRSWSGGMDELWTGRLLSVVKTFLKIIVDTESCLNVYRLSE